MSKDFAYKCRNVHGRQMQFADHPYGTTKPLTPKRDESEMLIYTTNKWFKRIMMGNSINLYAETYNL